MDKRRKSSLRGLYRIRRLAEQRAEMALEQAGIAVRSADAERETAYAHMDAVTVWKAGLTRNEGSWLDVYEHALASEQCLMVVAEDADALAKEASAAHRVQSEHLLQANRDLKVVQRRSERGEREAAEVLERHLADDVADMWLSRRLHADR